MVGDVLWLIIVDYFGFSGMYMSTLEGCLQFRGLHGLEAGGSTVNKKGHWG